MGKQLKAQVSMEFVFLVGLAFMVMIVFLSSTRSEFDELRWEEERSLVDDVCIMVQQELIIAANVKDGYSRTIYIPEDLEGLNYTIKITNEVLLTYSDEYECVQNIPIVIGDMAKGNLTITKTNGTLYLS